MRPEAGPEAFDRWYDQWVANSLNDCPGRSHPSDLQEAFEAGYELALARMAVDAARMALDAPG